MTVWHYMLLYSCKKALRSAPDMSTWAAWINELRGEVQIAGRDVVVALFPICEVVG